MFGDMGRIALRFTSSLWPELFHFYSLQPPITWGLIPALGHAEYGQTPLNHRSNLSFWDSNHGCRVTDDSAMPTYKVSTAPSIGRCTPFILCFFDTRWHIGSTIIDIYIYMQKTTY